MERTVPPHPRSIPSLDGLRALSIGIVILSHCLPDLPPAIRDLPSVFDALQEQLGLRLQRQKGPIEYYVIDHVERPVEN